MNTDYPKTAPDPEHDDEDMAAAQAYLDRYRAEEDRDKRHNHAYIVMSLLPFNVRAPLELFLEDARDMYIQQRAIEMFALRHDEAAVPKIEQVIRTTPSNPRSAGIRALAKIGTPTAEAALLRIAHDIGKMDIRDGYLVLNSFKRLGYETLREGNKFSYRKSSADEWTHFGDV
jgi:hypothetical protein